MPPGGPGPLPHPIVVVGASAGGVESLSALARGLPADFPAPVLVVLHVPAHSPSALPEILSRAGALPALHPADGDRMAPGHIYVAPPDHHLLVDGDRVGVKHGPKENRHRPSVDALFRSAAYTCGPRAIGVVLSGMLDDGTSGLWSIKRFGGRTLVQHPDDAPFDAMPLSALRQVEIDHTLRAGEMGAVLDRIARAPVPKRAAARGTSAAAARERERLEIEVHIASDGNAFRKGFLKWGELTPMTCPECHGALVKIKEGGGVRFRCHTGHAFSGSALLAGITESVEDTLWSTMRALEEGVMQLQAMGEEFSQAGEPETAALFFQKAREAEKRSHLIHDAVLANERFSGDSLRQQAGDA